jgi:hypothetical protein
MVRAPHQKPWIAARRFDPSDGRTAIFSARYPFVIIPENMAVP